MSVNRNVVVTWSPRSRAFERYYAAGEHSPDTRPQGRLGGLGAAKWRDGTDGRAEYPDPHKGHPLAFEVVDAGRIEVISHQRKPSKPHVKSVSQSIDKIGFLVPLVVVQRDDRYVVIDGQHRFLAGKDLGLQRFPVVVVPDEIARRMMNLNVERHLNIRERSYVALAIYRETLEESPDRREDDAEVADTIEEAHNITLGLGYEENGRLAGSSFEPILKRCDVFLDASLSEAYEVRQRRGACLVEANRLVSAVSSALKEEGVEGSYLTAQIVSFVNPLKRARGTKDFDETFDKLLTKLRELEADPGDARRVLGG